MARLDVSEIAFDVEEMAEEEIEVKETASESVVADEVGEGVKVAGKCGGRRTKMTHEGFIKRVAEVSESVEVLGTYVDQNTKVECRCLVCGYLWGQMPKEVGRMSCAKCSGVAKLTHEEFLQKVFENDNNSSLDVLGTYSGSNKTVLCKCKQCGFSWNAYPQTLYNGRGCKNCFQVSRGANVARQAGVKFFAEIAEKHPDIEITGEYVTVESIFHCKCKKCKYEWDMKAEILKKTTGCGVCNGRIVTEDVFLKRLLEVNQNVDVIGSYKDTQTDIDCRCRICNYKWKATPSALTSGKNPTGCPRCGREKVEAATRKSHEEFLREMAEMAPDINVLGQYKNYSTKIACRCNVCGHEWSSVPPCLKNNGCPQCTYMRMSELLRKPQEQFISELAVVNPNVHLVGEYLGDSAKTKFQCAHCGHIWETTSASVLRQRSGCPECNRTQTSFVEKVILFFLRETLGKENVHSRDRSIGRELDVYASKEKIAVEYGSWFWHRNRLKLDKSRLELCRQKGIKLLVIYDAFDDDVDELGLNDEAFIIYRDSLGTIYMREKLRECIKDIYHRFNLDYAFTREEEDELFLKAKLSIAKKTTEEVKKELLEIHPDIEFLGKYEDAQTPMPCRCLKCGHQWNTKYTTIITQGRGCARCNKPHTEVVNLDTGEVYWSARGASLALGLPNWTIDHICRKTHDLVNGQRWSFLKDLTEFEKEELRQKFPDTFTY